MKVDVSPVTVPVKVMVCAPVVETENGMLKVLKPVVAGDAKLPIGVPSTLTWIGCTGDALEARRAAWNDSV